MYLYAQQLLKVSHHPVMLVGHRHCGSGDMLDLVCHVIMQDQELKGP